MVKEQIHNYTGHIIRILNREDDRIIKTFSKSGRVTRVSHRTEQKGFLLGVIPLGTTYVKNFYSEPPAYQEGVYYIVSHCFKAYFPNRLDILTCQEQVKNPDGSVKGCYILSNEIVRED